MGTRLIIKIEIIVLIAVVALLGYDLATGSNDLNNSITLATSHKSEEYTELYFENHNNLPKFINNNSAYGFAFTVHNLESKDFDYSYVVYAESDKGKALIDAGNFNLKNGGSKSLNENFGPLADSKIKIIVELLNKNQQIDFLIYPI
jgi:hypothetical protein